MAQQIDPNNLGFLVADVARLIRAEMDRRIGRAGLPLTHGEGRALAHLARAGSVRQTVLAERMGLEAMTISGLVDRLEEHGLVSRDPDPADRRAKLVSLTDAAADPLEAIRSAAAGLRAELAEDFDPVDWAALNADLLHLRDRLGQLREAARNDEEGAS